MANKFQLKRTTVSGRTANTTDAGNTAFIDKGELAVNLADRKVFSSDSSNAIFEIGSNLTNLSVTSNIILNNDAAVNFKTLAGYNVKFKHQSDDNFVFYTTDTTGGERAVFAIYANTNTSNLNILTPVDFNSTIYVKGLNANGTLGSAGEVLTSNGTTTYWQSLSQATTNVNASYTWSNSHVFTQTLVANGISISNNSAHDASLHLVGSTGGYNRFIQISPGANSVDILNIMASSNSTGGENWWSWGIEQDVYKVQVGVGFGGPGFTANNIGWISANGFSGNGSSITSVNAVTVGGNSASDLRTYSDTKAANAYSNAVTYTDTKIGTANTEMVANAAAAYTNAVSYTDTKIGTANTAMAANAAAAYSNAVTYTDTKIGTANTAMAANAAAAYSNAVTYTDTKIGTANTAMVANAAAAYTNAVSYTDTKIGTANTAMVANAGAAYTNAIAYSANASRLTSGTVAEPRLPYRMDQDVRTTDNVEFVNITVTGNITVSGTQTVIGGNSLSITDNMIYMNQGVYGTITNISGNGSVVTFTANNNYGAGWDVFVSGVDPSSYNGTYLNILAANATHFQVSNTNTAAYVSGGNVRGKSEQNPDLGFAFGYNDGSYHHGGFFRDASDGIFKVFDNYAPEPDDSVYIDTSNTTFHLANFQANVVYVGNTTVYSTINTTSFSGTANNSTNFGGSSLATIQGQITGNAATAYTNAVSYTDTKIGTANTAMAANAATAYSNAVTYTDTKIGTANTAMAANAAAAYSNAVTYADDKAANVYSLAIAFAANATNLTSGTVDSARLPVANSTVFGATRVYNSVSTISTTDAASASAVKNAYDRGIDANTRAASAQTAATSAYTNATTFAANATNLTNGTIPYARFPANIVNTSAAFTLSGIITHGANVVLGTVGLSANGNFGTAGQTLHSNGIATYWATDDNTTYDLLAVANTAVNAGLLRLKDVNNSNDTITFTGTGAATVSSNASHVIINATDTNETYVIKNIANTVANEARIELLPTDDPASNTVAKFIGGGTTVVSSNTTAVLITSADQYVGTVTSVTGGSGLTGSVTTSGALAVGAGSGITVNADDVAVNAQTGLIANATGLYVNATYIGTLSANNADYLDGQHGSYYTNATNITTGTLPYAQIPANVINTTAAFTRTGITTFSANVVLGSSGLSANASFGTAGHVLHSNGTATYWAADDQGVTSVATSNGLSGGTITSTGTLGVTTGSTLTVNTTGIHVNSALSIATLAAANGIASNNTVSIYYGANDNFSTGFNVYKIGNTTNAGGSIATNAELGYNSFYGYNGTAYRRGAYFLAQATEAWSNTALGTRVQFATTPNGSNTSSVRLTLEQNGDVTIGGNILGGASVNATSLTVGSNFIANTTRVVIGTAVGLQANGGIGTAGQVLHSNGTSIYWAADDNTNTTYDLLAVANTAANAGLLRLKDSSNANDTVTFTGTGTSTVSSNASHVIINSADQYVGTVTSVATANGLSGGTITSTGTLGVTTGSTLTVNTAGIHVNSALQLASLSLTGDLTVSGNLTVSGTRTYVNTTTLDVGDNIITLNADLGAFAPSENAGIEIMRGTSANVQFLWDETNDRWSTNTQPLATGNLIISTAGGINANGSYGTATHVLHSNGSSVYWAADDQGVTSVAAANGLNGGTITSTGTVSVLGGSTLTVNTTGVHVNSALALTSLAATSYVSVGNSTVNTYITGTQVQGNQNDTVSAPAYSWSTDTTTGIYRPAASTIGVAIAGVQELSVNATTFAANSLNFTGIGTLAAGNTTITGFANASVSVNSALLTVGTSFIANTTGVTTTGYVNASGTGYFGGDVTVNGGQVYTGTTQGRVKLATWSDATYGIGMQTGYTYGGIANDYVISFQMSNNDTRGFWWGDTGHTNAQGAMALTTDGRLTVAHSARVGFGESDTTIPGSTYALEVNGAFAATTKSFLIDHPTKPDMKLRYGSLEGPENGVYVRGRLKDSNTIELPDYWTGLVDEDTITVNLTAIGKSQDLWVEDIADNKVVVGGENINCFYTVFAERKDVDKLEVEF